METRGPYFKIDLSINMMVLNSALTPLFSSKAGGPIADALQQALLPIVAYSTCSRWDYWGSTVTTSMICAGGDGELASCNVRHSFFFCIKCMFNNSFCKTKFQPYILMVLFPFRETLVVL